MLDLGLPVVEKFAPAMGEALAWMHWGAGVDAFDVEFVLGESRQPPKGEDGDEDDAPGSAAADLWLLDFNLCSAFDLGALSSTLTDDNEEKERHRSGLIGYLIHGFFANDPYYPRPWTAETAAPVVPWAPIEEIDVELWEVFAKAYLERPGALMSGFDGLDGQWKEVPRRFIEACVEKQKSLPPGVDKISD